MSDNLELKLTLRATDQGLSGTVRETKNETEQFNHSLNEASKSTGHFSDQLNESDKAAGRFYDEMGRLREANGRFVEGAKRVNTETGQLTEQFDKNAKKAKKAATESDGFNQKLADGAIKAGKWAAGIAAATVTAGVFAVTLNTEAIRETNVLAETLGTSTQALTEWEYAATQVNVSGEKVGDIFKDVSDKIGDFVTTGGGEAADLFENLNLKAEELINLAPDQQLLKIGDALEDVNRNQQIFFLESLADDASRLLPLLVDDAEALKRLQLEAQVLGVSLNDIDANKVTQAAQAFDRVQGLGRGLLNDFTIELAPILSGIADYFVDAAVEAGGFGGAVETAVDYTVTGVGFVLDYMQQLRILLKYSEQGWLMIGEAATGALASIADTTANVINTVMYPFQKSIAWLIEKYSYLIELGSEFGGPFADEFKAAAAGLKDFSAELDDFTVSAEDVIDMNKSVAASLAETTGELEALISANAPSEVLKQTIADLRAESEKLAKAQTDLGNRTRTNTPLVTSQKDAYTELVEALEDEVDLLGLTERERKIEINLRKLAAGATEEQKNKVRELTGQIYDYEKAVKDAEEAAKPWADAWDNAVNRVDETFADAWAGAFDSFEDLTDSLLDGFKQMLAEMAHLAFTKPITLNMQSKMEASGGGASGMLSGGVSGLNGIAGYFNPSSGSITASINNIAGDLGYGWAADGMGPPTQLIDPGSTTAGALNSLGAGFSAYGFAQKHGVLGGVAGGAASTAIAGGIGGLASGAGFMSGASGALAGLGPMGWAAIGVGALLGGMGGGETRHGQYISYTPEQGTRVYDTPSGGSFAEDEMNAAVASMVENLDSLLEVLGSSASVARINAGLKTSDKGRGGVFFGGELSTGQAFGEETQESYSPRSLDSEEAIKYFIEDLQQATIQGLQAADIGGHVGEYLAAITDTEALGIGEAQEIIDYITGFTRINEALESGSQIFGFLPDNVDDAVAAIAGFSIEGEALTGTFARVTAAYASLLTEQDINILRINETRSVLDEFNGTFGATISSSDELKDYALSLDLTTESGRDAFNAVAALAPALAEYDARTGEIRDTITSFYADILGREPDAEGFEAWFEAIASGSITLEEAAEAFANSEEAAKSAFNALLADADTFAQGLSDQNYQDSLSDYDKAIGQLDSWYAKQIATFDDFIAAGAEFANGSEEVLADINAIYDRDLAAIEERFTDVGDAAVEASVGLESLEESTRSLADIASERERLEIRLLQLQEDTVALRQRERDALDESNQEIFDKITALEDQLAAADAAAQAEQQLAAQREAIASEAYSLETRLLQLQGDTATLRQRERDALDESNREIYDKITALEDLQAETAAATQAEQQLAAEREAIAAEAYSLETRLLQLQGDTATLRQRERDALDESNQEIYDKITALEDLQAETAAATQAEKQLAAEREAIAAEAYSLETRLLQLQGDTVTLRQRERDALDESNQEIYDKITALEDLLAETAAAAEAEKQLAAEREAIAAETYSLETRLLQLQGDTVALRERERDALDPSNLALFDRITALEDEQAAATAAAEAEQAAIAATAEAEQQLAAKREAISAEAYSLETRLLQLQGDTAALRERERETLAPANQALFDRITALEDEQAAAESAALASQQLAAETAAAETLMLQKRQAANDERYNLETEYYQVLGDTNTLRARERNALFASNRALYNQINVLKDQKSAAEEAAQASRGVIDEILRLRGLSAGAEGFGIDYLQAQFNTANVKARAGDLDALAELPALSKSLEKAALESASSALEVQRMNAWLADAMATTLSGRGIEVPQFANGGNHLGGWRVVGERGPELEYTGASQIINNSDSMQMLDNRDVVVELRATRQELQQLRQDNKKLLYEIAKSGVKTVRKLDKFDKNGMPEVRSA